MNVEMTNEEAQEFADWLRERAERYLKRADIIERDFAQGNGEMTRYKRVPRDPPLTSEELEKVVREKSGRVKDVAERLSATSAEVTRLLEPASKVYLAERGWLKVRELFTGGDGAAR